MIWQKPLKYFMFGGLEYNELWRIDLWAIYLSADKWRHYARHCYIWLIGLKSELHTLSMREVSETKINHIKYSPRNHSTSNIF